MKKKKKITRWNFSVLRFLQFRQNFTFLYFYLFFLLKMLVIWIVIFLIVIHSLLLYFEKKFSKFPLANFPFPFSKRVKGHLGRYCFKGNCFFFPFYATIAAFVPFPLFRGMSGSFGTWRDIKREGGRLFRSNKFRANCKILFTGSPMYILHIYRERARWELVWLEAWFWSENFEHFFQSCTRNVKLVVTNCTCNLDHTQMRRVNFKRILLEPLSLALPFFHPFAHKSYQVQVL